MESHDDDFDSVSWRNDPSSDASRPTTSGTDADDSAQPHPDTNGKRRMSVAEDEPQAGPLADAVDLAGIGDGMLECAVDAPLKENDGTKDAYISYLVTTHGSHSNQSIITVNANIYNRQTSRPSKKPTLQSAADSAISFSSIKLYTENIRPVQCHHSPTNTK